MSEQDQAVSQAEFSRLMGYDSRSYVTALKKAGRLVLNESGQVLVEASRRRIAETADPNRDDVRSRFAEQRGGGALDIDTKSEREHKAERMKYDALSAKFAYEKAIGKIIEMDDASQAQQDAMSLFSLAVNQFCHRVGAELVGKDLETIRAVLKQEGNAMLTELLKAFEKWKTDYQESI